MLSPVYTYILNMHDFIDSILNEIELMCLHIFKLYCYEIKIILQY